MNWNTFQLHDLAQDKAFETLCNQLFENWCKKEYGSDIISFNVVNGAGGDGGVESYAVLSSCKIIGLQAKWFPTSIDSSQVAQVRNSIKTAMRVRPEIFKYIVCIPRDLASKTAKSKNNEQKRWDDMLSEIKKDFPTLSVELWNDTRLTTELQNSSCAGICRFWFEKSEISKENLMFAFEKAKNSWLHTKYEPDLNTEGDIEKYLQTYLGNLDQKKLMLSTFKLICKLCNDFNSAANELLLLCSDKSKELSKLLNDTQEKIKYILEKSKKIIGWLYNELVLIDDIDEYVYDINFESIIEAIKTNNDVYEIYFHKSDVIKPLKRLSEIDYYDLIENIKFANIQKSLLFIGNPGTGKTHGVSAFSEKILSTNLHMPILIQAKDISTNSTWKDIVNNALGMGNNWSEEELWQGLTSLVNRHRFYKNNLDDDIKIIPKLLVIVDGLDEFSTRKKWLERIKEANVISHRFPQIRFCFTARPLVFEPPYNWSHVVRIGSNGDVPVYKLFDSYIKAYNVTAKNSGWLRYALSSPLALKLFCELNRNNFVDYSTYSDIAIPNLWRKKIETIENEYSSKENVSSQNQYVLKAIVLLSQLFIENSNLKRDELLTKLSSNLSIDELQAEKLIRCFEIYGIINCYYKQGTGILPDSYFYYPGIQGYFDYATAVILIEMFGHPKDIDFNKVQGINHNSLYGVAIVSIQKYNYLITHNKTICSVIDEYEIQEIQFYALQHTDHKNAEQFVKKSKEIMSENASGLITIVNKLVLHFSRYDGHPLGVSLLDNFLNSFDKPAKRDIMWSVCGYLKNAHNKKWYQSEIFELENEEYILTSDDTHNGCPVVYAWALSTINNNMRKLYRKRLMEWAFLVPEEFYKLFLKFSNVNDPQIRSDLFSILVCLIHECADNNLIETVSRWICDNVLHPSKIDNNRDISIRYYSIAILRKAVFIGVFTYEDVSRFLPPYRSLEFKISLNKEALNGTRMSGYSAIDYDLARYVLIDHFESKFGDYYNGSKEKFYELIKKISMEQPEYKNITMEQFVISAAYSYLLQMGWNETEFYNLKKDESGKIIDSVDCSISSTYYPSTHGAQSPVMTVCEKYIWQARNYISGFLCDRLPFGYENIEITDYGLLDDFVIPAQEIKQIDPDNIPIDNPWHIPENTKVILEGNHSCKNDVISSIKGALSVDWKEWLFIENQSQKYKIKSNYLLALSMYSCFYGSAGVETNLFVNSILIKKDDISKFLNSISNEKNISKNVYNPTNWFGGVDSSCYITPKEICWFPWKSRYDSTNIEEFPFINISSAVDECIYNFPEFGDVSYQIPSTQIRELMGICNTDGYSFYDGNNVIKSEYCITGEKYGTYQSYLLIDKDSLLSKLSDSNKTLIWIMKEYFKESGKTHEKYGEFYAEKTKVYVGYFNDDKFYTIEIKDDFISSERNF